MRCESRCMVIKKLRDLLAITGYCTAFRCTLRMFTNVISVHKDTTTERIFPVKEWPQFGARGWPKVV